MSTRESGSVLFFLADRADTAPTPSWRATSCPPLPLSSLRASVRLGDRRRRDASMVRLSSPRALFHSH
jgi:hypothetical protein